MAIAYARNPASRPDVGLMVTDITLDGSYSAGGYALDNAQLGLVGNPVNVACDSYKHATATVSNLAQWDKATNKIKIFETAGTVDLPFKECAAGDITSSHVITVTALGTPRL